MCRASWTSVHDAWALSGPFTVPNLYCGLTECSAVGSVHLLGRWGRRFESCHSDIDKEAYKKGTHGSEVCVSL